MINLLPPDHRKQLSAARNNVLLLRYNLLIGASFIFLMAAIGVAFVYIVNEKAIAQRAIDENLAKEQQYSAVKSEVATIKAQLSDAKSILESNSVSYSRAAARIANLLPEGTALQSLSLTPSSFGTPQTIPVQIANQDAAVELMASLKNSSYVASVSRGKISTSSSSEEGGGKFPYTMEVTMTFTKEIAE